MPTLMGEVPDSRFGARNVQDKPGTFYHMQGNEQKLSGSHQKIQGQLEKPPKSHR